MAANMTPLLISLIALGAIAWGYQRSRAYGQLGFLAWLQSVLLTAPWLLFFGLFSVGIYLNIAAVLFLFVGSTVAYIAIGRRMRSLGQSELLRQKLEKALEKSDTPQTQSISPDTEQDLSNPSNPSTSNTTGTESASAPSSANTPTAADPSPNSLDITPIPSDDLKAIQGIFGVDTFFATETIPYQEGAIFKGNLRGDPVKVLSRLEDNLARIFQHAENPENQRYRLYLINNIEERPVVVVLPTSSEPQPANLLQWALAAILFFATSFTCIERAALQFNYDVLEDPQRWNEALPIGLALFAIVVAHEMAHLLIAKRYRVRLGPAFLIPAWQLGSFGGITRIESVLPNRKTLFDIAVAGPAMGGLLSLGFLLVGLGLSSGSGGIPLTSDVLQGSLLVGGLARLLLGNAVQNAMVQVHPFVIVGWLGLVITALNLLPAGQLDGGRMVQAIYGRKMASRATFFSLVLLAIFALANPVALYWAILVLILQRQPERPSRNELTEPDDTRAALCLLLLFLALAVLFPLSPSLAAKLGIGVSAL